MKKIIVGFTAVVFVSSIIAFCTALYHLEIIAAAKQWIDSSELPLHGQQLQSLYESSLRLRQDIARREAEVMQLQHKREFQALIVQEVERIDKETLHERVLKKLSGEVEPIPVGSSFYHFEQLESDARQREIILASLQQQIIRASQDKGPLLELHANLMKSVDERASDVTERVAKQAELRALLSMPAVAAADRQSLYVSLDERLHHCRASFEAHLASLKTEVFDAGPVTDLLSFGNEHDRVPDAVWETHLSERLSLLTNLHQKQLEQVIAWLDRDTQREKFPHVTDKALLKWYVDLYNAVGVQYLSRNEFTSAVLAFNKGDYWAIWLPDEERSEIKHNRAVALLAAGNADSGWVFSKLHESSNDPVLKLAVINMMLLETKFVRTHAFSEYVEREQGVNVSYRVKEVKYQPRIDFNRQAAEDLVDQYRKIIDTSRDEVLTTAAINNQHAAAKLLPGASKTVGDIAGTPIEFVCRSALLESAERIAIAWNPMLSDY